MNRRWMRAAAAAMLLLLLLAGCGKASHEGEVQIPGGKMKGRNYQDVEEIFRQQGFTNIRTEKLEDLVLGWLTKDGDVEEVSVAGATDYTANKWVPADTRVVIRYHTFPAGSGKEGSGTTDQPSEQTVVYSTNDEETVKNGNSGVYAYKSSGEDGDEYYIIDFEEAAVYRFSDSDGTCQRVKMVSGDLNDGLVITYHNGGDVRSGSLRFERKNQPERLIVQEADGTERTFEPAGLREALAIRDAKTLVDY